MACPRCGCKECHPFDDDEHPDDDRLERCSACRLVFDIDDHRDEEEDLFGDPPPRPPAAFGQHDFDHDAVCTKCGFDGAEWSHWKNWTYEGKANPDAKQPLCTS